MNNIEYTQLKKEIIFYEVCRKEHNHIFYFRCECLERWCFIDVVVVLPGGDRHPINSRRDTALRTAFRKDCSTLPVSNDSSLST